MNPDHGYWSLYAEPSLTNVRECSRLPLNDYLKDVLKETNCQLVVLYAIDGNRETPKKGWLKMLDQMGVDHKEVSTLKFQLTLYSGTLLHAPIH